jgi:hypothetical protein
MSNKEDKDKLKEPINIGEQNQNKSKRSSSKESTPKGKPIAYAGPEQVVYEGSEVILEGSCNLDTEQHYNSTFHMNGNNKTIIQMTQHM